MKQQGETGDMNGTKSHLLSVLLRITAVFIFVYFSLSHWFFWKPFFNFLGIYGSDLESRFVTSQLHLIAFMVMGYSLLLYLISTNPRKHRGTMVVVMLVGLGCSSVFIGNVLLGTLPKGFLLNTLILVCPMVFVVILFPWREKA